MTTIHFYWDIGSTNTYFAYHLVQPIAAKHQADIVFHPFNLGYVFRSQDYKLMEEPRAKLSNRRRDLQRWAAHHNLPFRMPDQFPIKTAMALRGSLVMRQWDLEQPYLDALFKAYWEANDASIAGPEGLGRIVASLGRDAEEFVSLCDSDEFKDALAKSTNDGLESGIFGAPTFMIDGEIYWGKDRFEFIDDHLAGRPALPPRQA